MVEQITMNVDDTLELDYLVEQINDNTIDVTGQPNGASFSLDYGRKQFGIFDPSDPGIYTLDIDGQTVEIDVYDIPDSAVLRLKFNDETDTTTAIDSEGDNNGSINGATYTSSNVQEGSHALKFDPNNSAYVSVPSDPVMDVSDFWISTWIYPRAWGGEFDGIVTRGQQSSSSPLFGIRESDTAGQLFAFFNDVTEAEQEFSTSFSTNTWYHLIATGNSTGGIDVFVNGSPDNGSASVGNWDHGSDDLEIARRAGSDQNYANIIADDFILGNEILTDQQAADLYSIYG
jgi:hypothetical protein